MSAAKRIGKRLEQAMHSQGIDVRQLAQRAGKGKGHVEAVLAGYPNTPDGETMLDTVNDIAAALGMRLVVAETR